MTESLALLPVLARLYYGKKYFENNCLFIWWFKIKLYLCITIREVKFKTSHTMNEINKLELLRSVGERSFNPNETMKVLKHNYMARMASWGARGFTVTEVDEYKEVKALYFRVSGHHHKGYVLITLGYNDTYTVRIVKMSWEVVDTYTDVYFDELVELIDKRVERIPAYKR